MRDKVTPLVIASIILLCIGVYLFASYNEENKGPSREDLQYIENEKLKIYTERVREGIDFSTTCTIYPKFIDYDVPVQQGYSFKIVPPDNDFCILSYVVMSKDDYVRMQNNVGVFTVLNKSPVVAKPTIEYCQLAKWLWDAHMDTYPDLQLKFKKYMLPEDCEKQFIAKHYKIELKETLGIYDDHNTVVVPEFGLTSALMLSVSIISMLVLSWRTKIAVH
jgi:hypothetical protein